MKCDNTSSMLVSIFDTKSLLICALHTGFEAMIVAKSSILITRTLSKIDNIWKITYRTSAQV